MLAGRAIDTVWAPVLDHAPQPAAGTWRARIVFNTLLVAAVFEWRIARPCMPHRSCARTACLLYTSPSPRD
eukprot:6010318-Alexandrium_andersonii.AAC.1